MSYKVYAGLLHRGIFSASRNCVRPASVRFRSSQDSGFNKTSHHLSDNPSWVNTLDEAKRMVNYPSDSLCLRKLMTEEYGHVVQELFTQKHWNHPLRNTLENLMFNDGYDLDSCWDLIVLLVSKAIGHKNVDLTEEETASGILCRQRTLAEVMETTRTAHLIHNSIVNIPAIPECLLEPSDIRDLELGNKMAVLLGDYLYSIMYQDLAQIRNQEVSSLTMRAKVDLIEECFQQNGLTSTAAPEETEPGRRQRYGASLIGWSCQGTLQLAGHDAKIQQQGRQFGQALFLAWQVSEDLKHNVGADTRSKHDQSTSSALAQQSTQYTDLEAHLQNAMWFLSNIEESDASVALGNMVQIVSLYGLGNRDSHTTML